MVRLVPMTESEFRAAVERSVPRHAERSVQRGEWAPEGALEASRSELLEAMPEGLATPGRFFATITNETDGRRVGEVWYSSRRHGGKIRFWVEWLWIDPEHRRRGYAAQALEQLAAVAVAHGADRMGLYVYVDNPGAVALYTKLGFVTKNLSMVRALRPAGSAPGAPVR